MLKVDAQNPDKRTIRYAASWLRRGAVIAIPTDTLYALAADPVNLAADPGQFTGAGARAFAGFAGKLLPIGTGLLAGAVDGCGGGVEPVAAEGYGEHAADCAALAEE